MAKQTKKAKGKSEAQGLIVNQEVVLARRLPDGKSEMAAFLHRGKKVNIIGSEGEYYKISVHLECFVPKRFVAIIEEEKVEEVKGE